MFSISTSIDCSFLLQSLYLLFICSFSHPVSFVMSILVAMIRLISSVFISFLDLLQFFVVFAVVFLNRRFRSILIVKLNSDLISTLFHSQLQPSFLLLFIACSNRFNWSFFPLFWGQFFVKFQIFIHKFEICAVSVNYFVHILSRLNFKCFSRKS